MVDLERIRWESPEALAPGKHTLEFDFKYNGAGIGTLAFNSFSGIGQGGTGTLKVDGKAVATKKMKRTLPLILQWDETFDIGSDTGTPVEDKDYQIPFKFTGKLNKLTLKIAPPKLTEAEERLLRQEGQRNNRASE
jgi:arylsulfatase